jgi:hypothetical protein
VKRYVGVTHALERADFLATKMRPFARNILSAILGQPNKQGFFEGQCRCRAACANIIHGVDRPCASALGPVQNHFAA